MPVTKCGWWEGWRGGHRASFVRSATCPSLQTYSYKHRPMLLLHRPQVCPPPPKTGPSRECRGNMEKLQQLSGGLGEAGLGTQVCSSLCHSSHHPLSRGVHQLAVCNPLDPSLPTGFGGARNGEGGGMAGRGQGALAYVTCDPRARLCMSQARVPSRKPGPCGQSCLQLLLPGQQPKTLRGSPPPEAPEWRRDRRIRSMSLSVLSAYGKDPVIAGLRIYLSICLLTYHLSIYHPSAYLSSIYIYISICLYLPI